ncbi:GatB/YqeY domain-containing protein, partial [Vibrio cholerae]
AITESAAEGMQDMGKVMAVLKPHIQGRADMGKVSGLVRAKLA